MIRSISKFTSVWFVVALARSEPGDAVVAVALAATELRANSVNHFSFGELGSARRPPYPTDATSMIISVDAVAIAAFHVSMGWTLPERIVDLLIEFSNLNNRSDASPSAHFSAALLAFGLPPVAALRRASGASDLTDKVNATAALFERMASRIDMPRALLRGRYLVAVARMERAGVPVDVDSLHRLRGDWMAVRNQAVKIIDRAYQVFTDDRLDPGRFEAWLVRSDLSWPRSVSGELALDDETFREMSRLHPIVRPLKDLRSTLLDFRPGTLIVGSDDRNRTALRPFHARTGRNQPRSLESIFAGPAWIRNLIKPAEGNALAILDWQQQEFGIAAALSRDPAMIAAYTAGDPFMALAISAGAAPVGATKASHGDVREQFKACVLSAQYGVKSERLARMTGQTMAQAQALLGHHRKAFSVYWDWSDAVETEALITGEIRSVFGWRMTVAGAPKWRAQFSNASQWR